VSAVAGSQGAALGRRALRPAAVLAVGSASSFLVYLDATIVNIAFPDVRASFSDVTLAGLSWILSAYAIVFAALLVMAAFPPERRMHAVGLMAGVAALASALGPVLGGLMVDLGGWRLVFLVNLPIGLAALVFGRRMPEPPRRPQASRPDLLGSLVAVVAVGALALGAVQGPVWGWGDPRTIAAFMASAVLAPLLVWRSAVHRAPVLELALFRVRSFSAGNLGSLLLGTSFFGLVLANSLYLTQVWDYSVLRAGLAIAPGPLASAVAAISAARFTDRVDPRRFVLPGALISAIAGVWLALRVGPEPAFLAEWLPGMLLMGTGVGLGFATTVAVCVRDLGPAQLGIGSGMSATTRQLGAVLGVAILIAILGPAPGAASYDSGWWAMAGLALVAVVPVALIGRRPG
jgi:MFS family permease